MSDQNTNFQLTNNSEKIDNKENSNQIESEEKLEKIKDENDIMKPELSQILEEIKNKKQNEENSKENSIKLENENEKSKEEEKKNEEKNIYKAKYSSPKQKMIIEEESHQKLENLKKMQKYYDDVLNDIINNWETNKENFELFF